MFPNRNNLNQTCSRQIYQECVKEDNPEPKQGIAPPPFSLVFFLPAGYKHNVILE